PPATRTHKICLAPVLSATFSRDSCWIIPSTPHRRAGSRHPVEPGRTDWWMRGSVPETSLGLLGDGYDSPTLGGGQRARFHDPHLVAHAGGVGLVVDLDPGGPADDLAVQRVLDPVLHLHHHGLVHFVTDHVATAGLAVAA